MLINIPFDTKKKIDEASKMAELHERLHNHASKCIWDPSLPYKVHNYCLIELEEGLAHVELLPPTNSGIQEPFECVYSLACDHSKQLKKLVFSWYSEIGPTGPLGMVIIQNNINSECFHIDELIPVPGTEGASGLFDMIIGVYNHHVKRGILKEQLICNTICN